VLNREIVIPLDCLSVAAELAGLSLPPLIRPRPYWLSHEDRQVRHVTARQLLTSQGLARGAALTEDFADTLAVLGAGQREFSAIVESPRNSYRLHIAAHGQAAVFTCYVPSSQQVLVRPARSATLAEDLVRELPGWKPAAGPALSVPESELRQAIAGAPARRDVRRVLDVAALPRSGGGQIYAGVRDGVRGHRGTRDNVCTFYDTDRGRYVFSFTGQPGRSRFVNVTPGRPETLVRKAYELLDQLG
jgi:hypothetical protein